MAAEIVVTGLEDLVASGFSDLEIGRLRSHFQELFALLARHHENVGRQCILSLEWQLFPVLGIDAEAPVLHKTLVEDHEAFVELVTWAYRPHTADEEDVQDAVEQEKRRNIASRAYGVLNALHTCPGLAADGSLDRLVRVVGAEARRVHRFLMMRPESRQVVSMSPKKTWGQLPGLATRYRVWKQPLTCTNAGREPTSRSTPMMRTMFKSKISHLSIVAGQRHVVTP